MGADVYSSAPASTRRFSGTTSATIAAPAAHSPPMPRLATVRKAISIQMLVAAAHAAVPSAYISIVSSSVRVRPMRSAIWPNRMPPAAQPSSRIDVRMPPQRSVAAFAAADPIGRPSSVGTQLGAT